MNLSEQRGGHLRVPTALLTQERRRGCSPAGVIEGMRNGELIMQERTRLVTTGATVPAWSWEISTLLRIHGALSNRDLASLLGRPEPRVSEVVRKMEAAGVLNRRKRGKEVVTYH